MAAFVDGSTIMSIVQPGDLVEFDRGPYSHFALYLGGGVVMNVNAPSFSSDFALVSQEKLEDVLNSSPVRIQNYDTLNRIHLSVENIIQTARQYENQRVDYGFLTKNCEYYCTMWRFGDGFSVQTQTLFKDILESEDWVELLRARLKGVTPEMLGLL